MLDHRLAGGVGVAGGDGLGDPLVVDVDHAFDMAADVFEDRRQLGVLADEGDGRAEHAVAGGAGYAGVEVDVLGGGGAALCQRLPLHFKNGLHLTGLFVGPVPGRQVGEFAFDGPAGHQYLQQLVLGVAPQGVGELGAPLETALLVFEFGQPGQALGREQPPLKAGFVGIVKVVQVAEEAADGGLTDGMAPAGEHLAKVAAAHRLATVADDGQQVPLQLFPFT